MKLNTVNIQLSVFQGHNRTFVANGSYFKIFGKIFAFHNPRVIASDLNFAIEAFENIVVADDFAVGGNAVIYFVEI